MTAAKSSYIKAAAFIITMSLSPALHAQVDDSFDAFIDEANADFDSFLREEEESFADFLRDPWREFASEQPVERPARPEPVEPPAYDAADHPETEQPASITIGEIFKLNRVSGDGAPTITVIDAARLDFGSPHAPTGKGGGTVTVRRDTVLATMPAGQTPADAPAPTPDDTDDAAPSGQVTEAGTQRQTVTAPTTPRPSATPASATAPDIPARLSSPADGRLRIAFGGTGLWMTDAFRDVRLPDGTSEDDVADAYEALLKSPYRTLIDECKEVARAMSLNGWGYNSLVGQVAAAMTSDDDRRVMLRYFILNESGYDARVCRKAGDGSLMLLVATDCGLFGYPYANIDGRRYYNITDHGTAPFYACPARPGQSSALGMSLSSTPRLGGSIITSSHTASGSPLTVRIGVPGGLADFYRSYPQCDYAVYLGASVDAGVSGTLLSALRPALEGKSQAEAAGILIDFVQTAFDYKTDGEQFGYEKPFFVEEMFCYPYSDCEDRAILYAYLVRSLLGLDVVLLDYPNHIATAVAFDEEVNGDSLTIGGRRFLVCDPTYIGAPIGKAMPQFRGVKADVIIID